MPPDLTAAEIVHALADLRGRVERLEQMAADRTHPAVAEAGAVVDAELCSLARTADLGADR